MSKLQALVKQVETCRLCPLCRARHQAVPGEGNENATVLLIGEGPGYHEDREGRPFIGPAGQFLDELLGLAGLRRPDVYITNVVKCRPPNNRDPLPPEIDACGPYLDRQIAAINPKVIITLGRFSMAKFVNETSISRIHGQSWPQGERVIVTMYHPAAGLHNDRLKDVIREDFRKLPGIIEQAQHGPVAVPPPPAAPPEDTLALLDAYAALVAIPEPESAPVVVAEEAVIVAPEPTPAPVLVAEDAEISAAAEPASQPEAPLLAEPVGVAEAPGPFQAAAEPEATSRPRRTRKATTPVPVAAAEPEALFPDSATEEPAMAAEATIVPPIEAPINEPVAVAAETTPEPTPVLPQVEDGLPVEPPPPRKKGKAAPAAEQLSLF